MTTFTLDLTTPAGRIAMRAYLDAIDAQVAKAAADADAQDRRWSGYVSQMSPTPAEVQAGYGRKSLIHAVLHRAFDREPEKAPGQPAEGQAPTEEPVLVEPEHFVIEETAAAVAEEEALPEAPTDPDPTLPTPKPAEPPAPVDLVDVAPEPAAAQITAELCEGDPERPWTEELRWAAWSMFEGGFSKAEVAEQLNLRKTRVASFIQNVKNGGMRKPAPPAGAAQVPVPAAFTAGRAVTVIEQRRPPAQDPEMQTARLEEMAEAERAKFVTRSIHPEVRP